MDRDDRGALVAEVQCYSLDSGGYYSELKELNFTADLDLKTPLKKSIVLDAHPDLGFGDPAFNFKCYSENGDPIDLKQKPLQVKYIEDLLREQKIVVLYLCKEDPHWPVPAVRRSSVVVHCAPSELAKGFNPRGSFFSSNGSGGVNSHKQGATPDGAREENDDEVFPSPSSRSWSNSRPFTQRQMKVFPSPSPPHNSHRMLSPNHSLPPGMSSLAQPRPIVYTPISLSHSASEINQLARNLSPSGTLAPPLTPSRSKSPLFFRSPEGKKKMNKTLQPPNLLKRDLDGKRSSSASQLFGETDTTHTISSPIQPFHDPIPPQSSSKNTRALRRKHDVIHRISLKDLGPEAPYDLSTISTSVCVHLTEEQTRGHTLDLDGKLMFYVQIFNYMTVGELKAYICREIEKSTALRVSALVLYYCSEDGEEYELVIETQFMVHTQFRKLVSEASCDSGQPQPVLQARLGGRLPNRELRVLYRISQLTGVLLEEDVTTEGVDTSNLTSLPSCDQTEVQNARRSLHSYMKKVVAERNEQEYCMCRDVSSREASMQLSVMTPSDNTIAITFHYKTDFSLRQRLSIHTYADRALSGLFPCLVASGLVRDRIEDYTMQVTGEESYIFGNIELIAFRHIRKCIVKVEPIHLSVTEKPPIEVERPHQFSLMCVDPLSTTSMNHHELSSLSPIHQEGVWSAWEIENRLSLAKLQVENLPRLPGRGNQVHAELRLLNGSKQLCRRVLSSSKLVRLTHKHVWNETLEFDTEIRNIPKAARILVTLVEGKPRLSGDSDKSQLLYWGMVSVFDQCGSLRAGDVELRLWKGEENRRTGDSAVPPNLATHPANNPHVSAVRVTVGFPAITPGPIVYPSTREESCSIFTSQHPGVSHVHARKQFRELLEAVKRKKLYKALPDYVILSNKLPEMLELFHTLDELQKNISDVPDYVALRLLDCDFPDAHVREFAVKALETLSDEKLEDYLLQLVQALKFESNHDSALARFLLKKSLTNKTIGHFFFWYLKSEMHSRLHTARFAIILEVYLKGCGEAQLTKFTDQVDIQNSLCDMAAKLRRECENGTDLERMQTLLPSYLEELDTTRYLFIPVHNPRNVLGKLKPKKCKVMSSKKRPMWLEMYNIHPSALRQNPIRLILKLGDDLRQDMITLRMFSLFEKLWEEQGLDLELIPYGCMATGPQTGFIEVVKNAKTIKEVSSVTNNSKLLEWIKSHQRNEFGEVDPELLNAAVTRFTRSCAGYSVATYVLGIGDRHNDNIMVTTSGNLFHIDFGHFLGHIKYFMGFKREWAPFVLTPDFVYVMGGENSDMFETYKNLCCRAFLTLRRNADLIINLFSLMRSTGIPELTCVEDTNYIRNVLEVNLAPSDHVAEMRFRKVIQKCLNLKWTVQIMWRLHIAKNGSG